MAFSESGVESSERCTRSVALGVAGMGLVCVALLVPVSLVGSLRLWRWPTCSSAPCQAFAAQLDASMDVSAEPCDSFYEFVCGRWNGSTTGGETLHQGLRRSFIEAVIDTNRKAHVPAVRQSAQQKAAMLFQSCEKAIVHNLSEARGLKKVLVRSGLFLPAWASDLELLNATLFLNARAQLETLVRVSLTRVRPESARDPLVSFVLSVRPSQKFLEYGSPTRIQTREHFGELYRSVREHLATDEADVLTEDELYTLHRRVRGLFLKHSRRKGRGMVSNQSEVMPSVSEAVWASLIESHYGFKDVSYEFHHPDYLREYFTLCSRLGARVSQQYLRWFVMAAYIDTFDAPSFVRRYGDPDRAIKQRSLFCFQVVRSRMGAAFTSQYVMQSFTKDAVASMEDLIPRVYEGFLSVFAENAWFKPTFNVPDNRNSSHLVLNMLEASKPATLEVVYADYGDMTTSFLDNWIRIADAQLRRIGNNSIANAPEADQRITVHDEDNSTGGWSAYYRTWPQSGDFELLPEVSALPFFSSEGAPLALQLAFAGSVVAEALGTLLFQQYGEWDRDSRGEFSLLIGCHIGRRVSLPALRPAQRRAMLRFVTLLVLAAALQGSADAAAIWAGVEKLPPGLRGARLLFAARCVQYCGVPGGRQMCDRPLADMIAFHNSFVCGPLDGMWKDNPCAVLFD